MTGIVPLEVRAGASLEPCCVGSTVGDVAGVATGVEDPTGLIPATGEKAGVDVGEVLED